MRIDRKFPLALTANGANDDFTPFIKGGREYVAFKNGWIYGQTETAWTLSEKVMETGVSGAAGRAATMPAYAANIDWTGGNSITVNSGDTVTVKNN